MRDLLPSRHIPFATALAIGTLGGLFFWLMGWPLAWLLGPMLATTIAALARVAMAVPNALRTPMLAVLGVLLGSSFTPGLVGEILGWVPTLLCLPFYVVLITLAGAIYLRRVARFDKRTALFGGMPGGFGEMVLLGDRAGADVPRLALVHAVRVLFIVLAVPFVMRALGLDLPSNPRAAPPAGWLDIVALLASAVLGLGLGRLLRLPAPALLGGMLVSGGAHAAGLVEGVPPAIVIGLAQLVIGCSIGCRFAGFRLHDILATMAAGLGLTLVVIATSALVAFAIHLMTGVEPLLLILALMPGGIAEMAIIALTLEVDPAFVAAHHLVRISIIVGTAPFVFQWLDRRQRQGRPRG